MTPRKSHWFDSAPIRTHCQCGEMPLKLATHPNRPAYPFLSPFSSQSHICRIPSSKLTCGFQPVAIGDQMESHYFRTSPTALIFQRTRNSFPVTRSTTARKLFGRGLHQLQYYKFLGASGISNRQQASTRSSINRKSRTASPSPRIPLRSHVVNIPAWCGLRQNPRVMAVVDHTRLMGAKLLPVHHAVNHKPAKTPRQPSFPRHNSIVEIVIDLR